MRVVPGLSSSSSGSSSTSRTPLKQESHSSSSSSSSPSSPTVGELSVREREDVTNSDISPVPVSRFVDDSSGKPDADQANQTPKTNKKETTIARGNPLHSDNSEIPEWLQEFRENLMDDEIPLQGDDRNKILCIADNPNPVLNEMWFLTIDPFIRIPVFIAKLSER